jgi:hypothetical protein
LGIQVTAAHIAPADSHTPTHGRPAMSFPAAKMRPCIGGYIHAYVGRRLM